jgi:hypothetical protein
MKDELNFVVTKIKSVEQALDECKQYFNVPFEARICDFQSRQFLSLKYNIFKLAMSNTSSFELLLSSALFDNNFLKFRLVINEPIYRTIYTNNSTFKELLDSPQICFLKICTNGKLICKSTCEETNFFVVNKFQAWLNSVL